VANARRLLILADDFTGACDAAAPFAANCAVLVVHGLTAHWPNDVDVLSVDLDLRERSDGQAEVVAREAARELGAGQPGVDVFVKIDSTLRGPLAGLVAGALAGSGRDVAVLAPAFPEQGRLLRDGRAYVDGRLGASLTEALTMEQTALLGARFARTEAEVERAVEHARMRGVRHVVVDADGPDCLQSVAKAWRRHAVEWLLVGSAGLARQVAGGTQHPTMAGASWQRPSTARASGPVLVVAGSPTPQTYAQLERLHGLGSIVVVLRTSPAVERDAGECARALADATAAWAADHSPSAVVLTGGATARLVIERLGARGVRLRGELQPGIPYGFLHGGRWHGLPVVTKAGGFGTPETLLDVVRALGVSSVAERTT
jgi:uncharacterized protein YgbK (DUF1537 family)